MNIPAELKTLFVGAFYSCVVIGVALFLQGRWRDRQKKKRNAADKMVKKKSGKRSIRMKSHS